MGGCQGRPRAAAVLPRVGTAFCGGLGPLPCFLSPKEGGAGLLGTTWEPLMDTGTRTLEGGDGGQRASWIRDRAWQLGSSKAGRSTCLTIAGDSSLCAGPGCPEGRATLVKRLAPSSCGHFPGFMRCCSLNRLGQSRVPLCPCCMEASASREFLRRTAESPPTFLFSLLGL